MSPAKVKMADWGPALLPSSPPTPCALCPLPPDVLGRGLSPAQQHNAPLPAPQPRRQNGPNHPICPPPKCPNGACSSGCHWGTNQGLTLEAGLHAGTLQGPLAHAGANFETPHATFKYSCALLRACNGPTPPFLGWERPHSHPGMLVLPLCSQELPLRTQKPGV